MSNKYCQALVELRNKPAHELKEVGDQWRTPDNIFWGINTLFGPFVLDLFTDGDNAKCAAYYTAEDNALAHDWSERLAELKGAAFGNSMPAAGAGYADFLPERAWLSANQSGGGNHAGIPFSECSGGASSRTGEKRRHHDKAWRGPGNNASYRGEGRRQRGGRDYPLTACR
ncbi:phage N-6-adenine-methyltransferase [Escherichia coli]|nr:phage N-6-adenine-methyltransferase [Escherichia coli]EFI0786189.1 phage N-6-adenine-methyltransferase [Escherichia coli]EKC9590719.1 phage N-6-adenine-methyltransferase [Escherichia coli]EKO4249913.1 phage N-6-adenine-methyltransferase [Escherichia coli]